jgi:hypothetical protein
LSEPIIKNDYLVVWHLASPVLQSALAVFLCLDFVSVVVVFVSVAAVCEFIVAVGATGAVVEVVVDSAAIAAVAKRTTKAVVIIFIKSPSEGRWAPFCFS